MNGQKKTIDEFATQYFRKNLILVLILALPISFLLFVVGLIADVLPYDLLFSLVPLLPGILYLWFIHRKTRAFRKLILRQEYLLGVCFRDSAFVPLYPKTLLYRSDAWFVKAGCWAFHRDHLRAIHVRAVDQKSRASHYVVIFETADGKTWTEKNLHSGDIQKLKAWYRP